VARTNAGGVVLHGEVLHRAIRCADAVDADAQRTRATGTAYLKRVRRAAGADADVAVAIDPHLLNGGNPEDDGVQPTGGYAEA
jgi:hypothetical protein